MDLRILPALAAGEHFIGSDVILSDPPESSSLSSRGIVTNVQDFIVNIAKGLRLI